RRARPTRSQRQQRPASRDGRRPRPLLRHRARRPLPHPGQQRTHRPDPLRGLAQPVGGRVSDPRKPKEIFMKPTIVLVHGAFAESSSWNPVIDSLTAAGHPVIAAATPLRGLNADAASIGDLIRTVDGPVVLVAHSYGGAVISHVPT